MRHIGDGLLALSYHVGASRSIARQSPLGIESHGAMQEDHVPHSDGVTVGAIHWIELVRPDDLLCHGRLPPAPSVSSGAAQDRWEMGNAREENLLSALGAGSRRRLRLHWHRFARGRFGSRLRRFGTIALRHQVHGEK